MSDQTAPIFFVEDEVFKERLHTCHTCENFNVMGLCKHCGCVMMLKAKLSSSSCPDGKWDAAGK